MKNSLDRSQRHSISDYQAIALMMIFGLLLLANTGCGGRPIGSGQDGGIEDLYHADVETFKDTESKPDSISVQDECIIAVRVDICCANAMPAFVSMVKKDPCLVPYPPSGGIPDVCTRPDCSMVKCASGLPESRLVEAIPGGGCIWKSECTNQSDCVLAIDLRDCCSSWKGYPTGILGQDQCLYVPGLHSGTNCPNQCKETSSCKNWPPKTYPPMDLFDSGPNPYCSKSKKVPKPLSELNYCGLRPV